MTLWAELKVGRLEEKVQRLKLNSSPKNNLVEKHLSRMMRRYKLSDVVVWNPVERWRAKFNDLNRKRTRRDDTDS